jgi:hypothetical protein
MSTHKSDSDRVDARVAELLATWSDGMSRRHLISRLGRWALTIAGVSLVPLLPADRAFAQGGGCGLWHLCGLYGYRCKACCGKSDEQLITSCPTCTAETSSAYWTKCCSMGTCPPNAQMVRYKDCCGPAPPYSIDFVLSSCRGIQCPNNPTPQPNWCTGGRAYVCSIIQLVPGSCSP